MGLIGLMCPIGPIGLIFRVTLLVNKFYGQAKGLISTGQLSTLLHVHLQPINLVVYQESHLSGLILGLASRLDAFSVYPCST